MRNVIVTGVPVSVGGLDLYGLRAKLAALGVEWVSAADEADTHG